MKKLIGGCLVLFMLACGAWAVVTRSSVITAGDASFMGNVVVYGNASFGTDYADTLTITSSVASSVIPSANNTYDLGGSGNRWKNGWFNGTMAVGTSAATSKLTIAGTMEMTSGSGGGIKFADGTSQFTAGVAKTGDTMTGKLTLPLMSLTGVATIATIASSPTIETPFIASFTNATHNHSNAAGGGNIPESSVTGLSSDLTNRLLLAGGVMTGILTLDAVTVPTAKSFAFNMADGTAPFTVVSTTAVTNFNADLLDGQSGAYYAAAAGVGLKASNNTWTGINTFEAALTTIATLQATDIKAFNLTGKLTAGANEIEGSNFDITGGSVNGATIGASSASTGVFTTLTANGILTAVTTLCTTPSGVQSLANDGTIECNAAYIRVIATTTGEAILDNEPAIKDGIADGQRMLVEGTSNTQLVTIADSYNCQLTGGESATLGQDDTIDFVWNSGRSYWLEISRSIK